MKFKSIFTSLTMQLIALSSAFVFSIAHADDYSDVTQLTKEGKYTEAIAKADAHILIKPRDPQMRFLKASPSVMPEKLLKPSLPLPV